MGRKEGKRAVYMDSMMQMMPFIMTKRSDATNTAKVVLRCDLIDKFIAEQKELGQIFNYNEVIMASLVRLYSKRWQLNRFVVGRKIYDRYKMTVAFVIKKGLRDNGAETTVKIDFDGSENIYEVRDKIQAIVKENSDHGDVNMMDYVIAKFLRMPTWILRIVMGLIRCLDRTGSLPQSLIDASPFHTSCFITFLKSIKCDYIYHHIYDFGTTGMFFAMGKNKMMPIVNADGKIEAAKCITMGVAMDERFCDGLYLANSTRYWSSLLANPQQLLESGEKMFTKEIVLERRKKMIEERRQKLAELKDTIDKNTKALKLQRKQKAKEQKQQKRASKKQ